MYKSCHPVGGGHYFSVHKDISDGPESVVKLLWDNKKVSTKERSLDMRASSASDTNASSGDSGASFEATGLEGRLLCLCDPPPWSPPPACAEGDIGAACRLLIHRVQ